MDRVTADRKFKELPDFVAKVGKACLCLRDGSWHRAIVKQISGDRCTVRLIDMALTAVAEMKQLRPLPAVLGQHPPLAYPCVLHGVNVLNIEITRALLENTIFCRDQVLVVIKEITENRLSVRFRDRENTDLSSSLGMEDEQSEVETFEVRLRDDNWTDPNHLLEMEEDQEGQRQAQLNFGEHSFEDSMPSSEESTSFDSSTDEETNTFELEETNTGTYGCSKDSASQLDQSEQATPNERPLLEVVDPIFRASHSFKEEISLDCQLAHVK